MVPIVNKAWNCDELNSRKLVMYVKTFMDYRYILLNDNMSDI